MDSDEELASDDGSDKNVSQSEFDPQEFLFGKKNSLDNFFS